MLALIFPSQSCVSLMLFVKIHTKDCGYGGNVGNITWKLLIGIVYVVRSFSIWLFVTIAVDRLYAITRPLQRTPISRNLKKVILILWLWSFVTSTNMFDNMVLREIEEAYFCKSLTVILQTQWTRFNVVITVLNGFLPLTLLALLYTVICVKLWTGHIPGDGANQNQRQTETTATAFKVTRMMIAVFVLFLVCWFPWFIMTIIFLFGSLKYDHWISFPIWLTYVYSGLNPYVYFSFGSNFRQGFKLLFGNIHVIPFRSQSIELQQI